MPSFARWQGTSNDSNDHAPDLGTEAILILHSINGFWWIASTRPPSADAKIPVSPNAIDFAVPTGWGRGGAFEGFPTNSISSKCRAVVMCCAVGDRPHPFFISSRDGCDLAITTGNFPAAPRAPGSFLRFDAVTRHFSPRIRCECPSRRARALSGSHRPDWLPHLGLRNAGGVRRQANPGFQSPNACAEAPRPKPFRARRGTWPSTEAATPGAGGTKAPP